VSGPVRTSYNRQRKAAYAAQADKSSRHEIALTGPVNVREATTEALPVSLAHSRRVAHGQKRGRQERAWARCKTKREVGKHETVGVNCKCCGCPASELGK
jgi:hypothetical protein